MLRRVERNNRANANGESPWSIRQTAVYNRLTTKPADDAAAGKSKSMFLFVAPSPNVEQQLGQCLEQSLSNEDAISPWNVQRILVADSMRNWMEYMAYLEEQLREQVSSLTGCSLYIAKILSDSRIRSSSPKLEQTRRTSLHSLTSTSTSLTVKPSKFSRTLSSTCKSSFQQCATPLPGFETIA